MRPDIASLINGFFVTETAVGNCPHSDTHSKPRAYMVHLPAHFTSQSMQQGGIGLLVTVLIVSSPPLAAMFFQGTMGNFLFQSAFGFGGARAAAMQQGLPPGAYSPGGYGPSQIPTQSHTGNQGGAGGFNTASGSISPNTPRLGGAGYSVASDTMKQGGSLTNPPTPGGAR